MTYPNCDVLSYLHTCMHDMMMVVRVLKYFLELAMYARLGDYETFILCVRTQIKKFLEAKQEKDFKGIMPI